MLHKDGMTGVSNKLRNISYQFQQKCQPFAFSSRGITFSSEHVKMSG